MSDLIIELAGPIFRGILKIIGYIVLDLILDMVIGALASVLTMILDATGLSRVLAPYRRGCAWVLLFVFIAAVIVIVVLSINGNAVNPSHF
ncbi:MAG: hypothetical protein IT324_18130 [Anaerolineae bacterium]|nr:hypothetical protein [Anaerolineae bacterium]